MKQAIGHDGVSPITIDAGKLLGTRLLAQANSGGGKSWMLRVLCERLGAATPIIVLDWEGEFSSLREKLDVLLVGREGEVPTAITTAGALASQILEMNVSAVIDLYDLDTQAKRTYVRRFLESLMSAPKRLWRPYFIVVDEAHSLVPEAGQAESADAVNALMCQGRKRQFCGILATQRLSKLHKDAAAECNNVLIGRTTLDIDQKRAGDILGLPKVEAVKLRELGEGEWHAYGPAFNFTGVRRFKGAEVLTTHGRKAVTDYKPPAPSARMQGAIGHLKDLAERSKTEVLDLDSARQQLATLKRQLADAQRAASRPADVVVDQGAIDGAVRDAQARMRSALLPIVRQFKQSAGHIKEQVGTLEASLEAAQALLEAPPVGPRAAAQAIVRRLPQPPATNRVEPGGKGGLPGPHQKIVDAVAWWESVGINQPTAAQVAFIAGYSPGTGTLNTYFGAMNAAGLICRANGRITLTEDGRDAANPPLGAATLELLHDKIRLVLEGPHRALLNAVIERGPGADTPAAEIAQAAGYSPGTGTINTYFGRMKSLGLIERRNGMVRATDVVFPTHMA